MWLLLLNLWESIRGDTAVVLGDDSLVTGGGGGVGGWMSLQVGSSSLPPAKPGCVCVLSIRRLSGLTEPRTIQHQLKAEMRDSRVCLCFVTMSYAVFDLIIQDDVPHSRQRSVSIHGCSFGGGGFLTPSHGFVLARLPVGLWLRSTRRRFSSRSRDVLMSTDLWSFSRPLKQRSLKTLPAPFEFQKPVSVCVLVWTGRITAVWNWHALLNWQTDNLLPVVTPTHMTGVRR